MPDRISLVEQYNNRDVIAQMYRVIDIVEHGAIQTVSSEKVGETVTVSFTMHDGTVHDITFPANGITSITSRQDGSTMHVDVVLDNGTTETISWTIVPGVTLDTAQTITGAKTYSALQTFLMGLAVTGMSTIDGDLQITNGHGLSVAGDIDTAGALKGDSAEIRGPMSVSGQSEIAGLAIEPNGSATVISNDNGISSDSPVTFTNIPTTATGVRDTKTANGTRIQNDLDNYTPMLRITGNQSPILGIKKSAFIVNNPVHIDTFNASNSGWHNIYDMNIPQGRWIGHLIMASTSNVGIGIRTGYAEVYVDLDGDGNGYLKIIVTKGAYDMTSRLKLCHDDNGWHLLFNCSAYIRHGFAITPLVFGWQANDSSYLVSNTLDVVINEPDSRYDKIVGCTEW